jgi:hypothetical protein
MAMQPDQGPASAGMAMPPPTPAAGGTPSGPGTAPDPMAMMALSNMLRKRRGKGRKRAPHRSRGKRK